MLFSPGRRLFSTASIAMIVVAALHTIGNVAGGPPPDAASTAAEAAMRAYRIPLGLGMTPSLLDIQMSLVFAMSICLLALGILGLLLAAARDTTPRLLSLAAILFTLTAAALTLLGFVYRVPPPLISFAVVTLLYAGAIRTTQRA